MKMTIKTEVWEVPTPDQNENSVTSPSIVFDIIKEDFDCFQENIHILGLSTASKLIQKFFIVKGTYNSTYVSPADILRPLLMTGCSRYILCHNHPSGDVSPSEEDLTLTKKLKKAGEILGITLLDHVIYTEFKHYSFRAEGLL